jgi:hypothetical protein
MSDNNNNLFSNDFNGTFFLSLGTLFITAISVCLGFALKSKCKNVKVCFGCLEIERDIDAEVDVEMAQPPAAVITQDQIPLAATRRRSYNLTEVSTRPAAAPAAETTTEDYRNSMTNTI